MCAGDLHLSQCVFAFVLMGIMIKYLRFEVVCFIWLSFALFIYFLQIHLKINFINTMKPTKRTLTRWQTKVFHAKHDVTYRRQHRLTHRTSIEKNKDRCHFEYWYGEKRSTSFCVCVAWSLIVWIHIYSYVNLFINLNSCLTTFFIQC